MWKKLIVFSLAFCLSLILLQLLKPNVELDSMSEVENISSPTNSNKVAPSVSPLQTPQNSFSLFEECVRKFKKAVAENDKETVASLIKFPLTVGFVDNKPKSFYKEIKNRDEFLVNYDKIFDDSAKKSIAQMESEHLSGSGGGVIPQYGYTSSGEFFNSSSIKINRKFYSFYIVINQAYKNDGTNFEIKIIKIFKD